MTLSEIPTVKIVSPNGYKYLVAELADANGNNKLIIREGTGTHKEIASALEKEVGKNTVRYYHGGGQIIINHEPWEDLFTGQKYPGKTITVYGTSGDFGMDRDRERTIALLQEAFPGYSVSDHD